MVLIALMAVWSAWFSMLLLMESRVFVPICWLFVVSPTLSWSMDVRSHWLSYCYFCCWRNIYSVHFMLPIHSLAVLAPCTGAICMRAYNFPHAPARVKRFILIKYFIRRCDICWKWHSHSFIQFCFALAVDVGCSFYSCENVLSLSVCVWCWTWRICFVWRHIGQTCLDNSSISV